MAIKAYEGNQPYIFISYAHKDAKTVLPILEALEGLGFRLWYDAGIEAGTEWPEFIAEHLNNSTRFLAFVSRSFVESQNCRREINFAIDLKKDPIVVYLEDFELSLGMRMQLGTLQGIMYYRHETFESFIEALAKVKEFAFCRDAIADQSDDEISFTVERMLAARMFDNVRAYATTLLENGYEHMMVYRALLLAEFGAKDESELIMAQVPIDQSTYYQKLIEVADPFTKKRFQDHANTVAMRIAARNDQASRSEKRVVLYEKRMQLASRLNQKAQEEMRLREELDRKHALKMRSGDPKRIVLWSLITLFFAALDFFSLINVFTSEGEAAGTFVFLGFVYYICSLIQVKTVKKRFMWVMLNIPTVGIFGWVHALVCLGVGKRHRLMQAELQGLGAAHTRVVDELRSLENDLAKINFELDRMN